MDYKKYYFGDFIYYGKHNSSYFNLPASMAVLLAFLLPGFLSMISTIFAYFGVLVLILVAAFERKSNMVKFYCLQFCFTSIAFNVCLSVLSIIGQFMTTAQIFNAFLSLVVITLTVIIFIYSLYNAFQYRTWKIPYIGDFVYKKFIKA